MDAKLLERDTFESWLATFADDAIVGIACDPADCPLARYLHDSGLLGVTMEPSSIRYGDQYIPAPDWMEEFAFRVDCETHESQVTAEEALAILATWDEV